MDGDSNLDSNSNSDANSDQNQNGFAQHDHSEGRWLFLAVGAVFVLVPASVWESWPVGATMRRTYKRAAWRAYSYLVNLIIHPLGSCGTEPTTGPLAGGPCSMCPPAARQLPISQSQCWRRLENVSDIRLHRIQIRQAPRYHDSTVQMSRQQRPAALLAYLADRFSSWCPTVAGNQR